MRIRTVAVFCIIIPMLLACVDKNKGNNQQAQQQQPKGPANDPKEAPKNDPPAQGNDGKPKKVVNKPVKKAPKEVVVAKIGEEVTFNNDSTWIVLNAENKGNFLKSNNMFQKDAQSDGKFIVVQFKVSNLTNKEERLFIGPKLIDSKGREFKHYDHESFYIPDGAKTMSLEAIPAGLPREFYAVFEVPADATGIRFQARDLKSVFSPDYKLVDMGF